MNNNYDNEKTQYQGSDNETTQFEETSTSEKKRTIRHQIKRLSQSLPRMHGKELRQEQVQDCS